MFSSHMTKPLVVLQILLTSMKEQVKVMLTVTSKVLLLYSKTNFCSQHITHT